MMPRKPLMLPLIVGLAGMAAAAQAAPPKPDFTNLPAYIRALNASQDPEAAAIRREIADGPAALARERAAAQAASIPLEPKQLQQPMPPPDQNAAPLYQQLDDLWRQKPLHLPRYAQPLGYNYAYTPDQIAAVRQIVNSRRDVFDLLHQATDRPQNVIAYDWSKIPVIPPFRPFAQLRESAREINTESYLLAHQGRYADAVTNQARGFRITQQSVSPPSLLINTLVAYAIDAITLSGLKSVLYMAGPNGDTDTLIQRTVSANRPHLSLRAALSNEVPISLSYYDFLRKDEAHGLAEVLTNDDAAQAAKAAPLSPSDKTFADDLVDAGEAFYLHQMRQLIAAADLPPMTRRATFAQINAAGSADNPAQALFDSSISVCIPAVLKDDQCVAQEQVTMAAAAVLAAKARAGSFPDTLPGDFPDPFSGKPLGYRREGDNGFVVYSVGDDGTFDGGKPGEYHFKEFQVFFRYRAPPLKPVPADMLK